MSEYFTAWLKSASLVVPILLTVFLYGRFYENSIAQFDWYHWILHICFVIIGIFLLNVFMKLFGHDMSVHGHKNNEK